MPAAVALGVLLFVVVWLQREVVDAEAPTLLPPVEVDSPAGSSSLPAPQVSPDLAPGDGEPGAGGVFSFPDAPPEPPAPPLAPAPPAAPVAGGPAFGESGQATADTRPVPVHNPQPAYPRRSLRRGEAGEVLVQALVGADGRPRHVEIAGSSSYRALDQAAVQAVRRWRFQPATRQGRPVAEIVHIPFTFSP